MVYENIVHLVGVKMGDSNKMHGVNNFKIISKRYGIRVLLYPKRFPHFIKSVFWSLDQHRPSICTKLLDIFNQQ
jgi:hypothetical protein